MRVALFTDTCTPQMNGVARTLGRLVEHLGSRGHEVALVSPAVRDGGGPAPGLALHLRLPGVPFPLYPELQLARPPRGVDWRALEAFRPDVIHCATESVVGWMGRRWALAGGRPLITSFHTDLASHARDYRLGLLAPVGWQLLRRFHGPARLTLCPSNATLTQLMVKGFHPRLRIWSRGVDAVSFSPSLRSRETRERLAPGAEAMLLFVGRLAPEKQLDVLLEAWPEIRRRAPVPTQLVLVGDGPMGKQIRERAEPGVRVVGYLSGEALTRAYASADVFVFPSDSGTFGNVVLEAMASGLPVVSVSRGGVTESLRHGETGLLVEPRNPRALAAAALSLLADGARRHQLAEAARRHAVDCRWDRILDGVVEAYEDVIAGRTNGLLGRRRFRLRAIDRRRSGG